MRPTLIKFSGVLLELMVGLAISFRILPSFFQTNITRFGK